MGDTERAVEAMQVGKKATVKVALLMEYTVEVEMPPNGDPGRQADEGLWTFERYDDYDEKDVIHAEILEQEPTYEDDYQTPEDWPNHV